MIEVLHEYPPYLYLSQVAKNCPKAVLTYMVLWQAMNKENKVDVYKKEVRNEYLISLSKFRHDLLMLVKEGLVSIDETPNVLHIELVGWDYAA
jgi:hypothetical protein